MNENEELICRFCFEGKIEKKEEEREEKEQQQREEKEEEEEEEDDNELISPCNCIGTQKYIHKKCLKKWQKIVLFESNNKPKKEQRHLYCSTCSYKYKGITIPTRLSLIINKCNINIIKNIQIYSLLVTSKETSEKNIPRNIPFIINAMLTLKSLHWKYGVYFIFSFDKDDIETGEEIILAINLTRPQDGSCNQPIPDEVLHEIEICNSLTNNNNNNNTSNNKITIQHHNGGPVNWSSFRTGTCIVNKNKEILDQIYQTIIILNSNPENQSIQELPQNKFQIISINSNKSFIIGPFSNVIKFIKYLATFTFPDESTLQTTDIEQQEVRNHYHVNSYSGYAQWTYAQLLTELCRPYCWGVVPSEISLLLCLEYFETGKCTIQQSNESFETKVDSQVVNQNENNQLVEEHYLWNTVQPLCLR